MKVLTKEVLIYMRFEVIMAVAMEITSFSDVTLCSKVEIDWCFGGTCYFTSQKMVIFIVDFFTFQG